MQWFKHDSDASTDSKIKKLLLRYGTDGYAIYFHCLELIAGDVSSNHITFELEHDAEIIADDLKIKGTPGTSAIDRTNEIMRYIVEIGLFEICNDRIFCFKMLSRLDSSMTSNYNMRQVIQEAKKTHDTIMIPSCKNRLEEKRIEKKRKDKTMLVFGEFSNVFLSKEYSDKLISTYGQHEFKSIISKLSSFKEAKGKEYKSDAGAISSWVLEAVNPVRLPPPPPVCPDCGSVLVDNLCRNVDCPRYA